MNLQFLALWAVRTARAKLFKEATKTCPHFSLPKGAFTNYVYKKRGVGGQKNRVFVNFYTIENVNGGG